MIRIAFFWIVTLGLYNAFAAEPMFVDKGEGKALVQDILTRMPPENTQVLGLLKTRVADGPIIEIPIKMVVQISGGSWEDKYETQPVAGHAGEVLVIRHHGLQPSDYLYGRFQNRGEEPKLEPISGEKLFQPLAGSDFYLFDLGLEFLHWPSQKIVKKEMRRSRSCRVVESVNPNPAPGTYSRVLSWIDLETSNLIMAQAFDANNRLLKEFSIRKFNRKEGLKEIRIENDQKDSRTDLDFNFDLPQDAAK
jgi:hypothetical protein